MDKSDLYTKKLCVKNILTWPIKKLKANLGLII